ncbi:MAG: SpoIIE family protein phosphatase [Clostridium sp.]
MGITVDIAYKSLNKYSEELCGDKVEILHTENSHILILADGMGSGVKANILATITSKVLGTMFLKGVPLEKCVETIAETLPVCKVRQMAYATFSILQVFYDGTAYLVEFDNPGCIFIRDGQLMTIPQDFRMIEGRKINEFRFRVQKGDSLILLSDGTINAGTGDLLNFGWTWDSIADYALKKSALTISAMHLATVLCEACDELYQFRPGDDTTVAVMQIIDRNQVNLMTGPAENPEDDERMIHAFMAEEDAVKVVCGGTSSLILSRVLDRTLDMPTDIVDTVASGIPPIAYIDGIDLVTEGVLTLNRALKLLTRYANNEDITEEFFRSLDDINGAAQLARLLIERCTELHLFVGKAVNSAYQNTELPFNLGIRQNLVVQIKDVMEQMGKTVTITYY